MVLLLFLFMLDDNKKNEMSLPCLPGPAHWHLPQMLGFHPGPAPEGAAQTHGSQGRGHAIALKIPASELNLYYIIAYNRI